MRHISECLNDRLQPAGTAFVQQQRQYNWRQRPPNQLVTAYYKCIGQQLTKIGRLIELLKVFIPRINPRASRYAIHNGIVFKGNDDPVHWKIAKYNEIDYTREQHQIKCRERQTALKTVCSFFCEAGCI